MTRRKEVERMRNLKAKDKEFHSLRIDNVSNNQLNNQESLTPADELTSQITPAD